MESEDACSMVRGSGPEAVSIELNAGQRWLVASFGVGCGMGYASWAFTMAQLQHVDPSGASGTTAAIVKFAMLSLSIFGLAGALRERADRRNDPA